MKYEEIIIHFEHHRNELVKVLKEMTETSQKEWIIWLSYELKKELGLPR